MNSEFKWRNWGGGGLAKDYVVVSKTICAVKNNKSNLMEFIRNCGSSVGPYKHNTLPGVGCCTPAVI
jgi:hypothetical protein